MDVSSRTDLQSRSKAEEMKLQFRKEDYFITVKKIHITSSLSSNNHFFHFFSHHYPIFSFTTTSPSSASHPRENPIKKDSINYFIFSILQERDARMKEKWPRYSFPSVHFSHYKMKIKNGNISIGKQLRQIKTTLFK
jgi:hypothetical protein